MLKKVLSLFVVCTLFLSMAGCSGDNGSTAGDTAPTSSDEADSGNVDDTPSQATGETEYVIKLSYENNDGDPIDQGCNRWAELVYERTNGAVEIQIYPSSQLGAKADLIEMMLMGQNVATIADGSYLMDYVPDFGIVMGPYILNDWDQMFTLTASDWWAEQEAKLEEEGLVVVSKNWVYGDRHLLTKNPVESLEDLRGMKIRVPNNDISVSMFNLLGASSTPMALAEVYTSLSQGVIEGVENPLTVLYDNNFQEVCKHLTLTGHQLTFSNFIMGKDFFDTIPDEYQQIIIEAGNEAALYNNDIYEAQSAEMIAKFEEAGVQIYELTDIDSFKASVQELYDNYENDGKWSVGLYDTIQGIIN